MPGDTNRTEPLGFRATRAANDAFRAICYKRGISMSEALNDALLVEQKRTPRSFLP